MSTLFSFPFPFILCLISFHLLHKLFFSQICAKSWWSGSKLEPGGSYSTRQYLVSSDLGSVKAIADPLRDQVVIEEHNENEYTPRNVDLYQLGSRFAAVAASSSSSTTSCGDASASLICTGKTTPSAGYLPWFYITCGSSNTHFGQDPYHFTPYSGTEFQFPGHSTPNYPVRSYVCDGQPVSVRPSWKLVGFFDDSCASLATSTYDDTVCPWDESWTMGPTGSPSKEVSRKDLRRLLVLCSQLLKKDTQRIPVDFFSFNNKLT